MSAIELRNKVIDKIRKIEDEDLLNEVNRIIEIETFDLYELKEEEKKAIFEAEN